MAREYTKIRPQDGGLKKDFVLTSEPKNQVSYRILGVVGVKGLFSHFLQFLGTAKLEVFQYYFIERRPEMALESRYYTRPRIQ